MEHKESFEIQSKFENVNIIIGKIESIFDTHKFQSGKKSELVFAVIEAYNNCVEHGYRGDETQKVFVTIELVSNELIICIQDYGNGFVVSNIHEYDPENTNDLFGSRGRGLFMMNNLVDLFEYIPCKKGTLIKLVKKLF